MLYLGIFWLEFKKAIVLFEINALKFVWLLSFVKNKNPTKYAWFAYFLAGIWEYYSHISNQRPQICLLAKFGAKIKLLKSWTKNTLFWYLWAEVWKKYCHIWNRWICLVAKFGAKIKILKFVTENAWFGLEFENNIVTFEICTLEFVKYESLNHTVNFGVGSAFHFFWRSGSGSGFTL